MPLEHSPSKGAFQRNVQTLMHDVGKSPHVQSRQQALAIAYSTQRRAGRADGGVVDDQSIGHGDPVFQVDPKRDNLVTGGLKIVAEPYAEVIRDAYGRVKKYMSRDIGGSVTGVTTDPVHAVMSALNAGAYAGGTGTPGGTNPSMPSSPQATQQTNQPTGIAMPSMAPPSPMPVPASTTSVASMSPMPQPRADGGGLAAGGVDFIGKGPNLNTPWYVRQEARSLHTGPVLSNVPGRTDNHRIQVPSGSYVLPAQHVASMGHGNTLAGMSIASKMFGGPYGTGAPKIGHGRGAPPPPKPMQFADGGVANLTDDEQQMQDTNSMLESARVQNDAARHHRPYIQGVAAPLPSYQHEHASPDGHHYPPVDVDVSGGEYIIPPWEIVRRYGSLDNGHSILDNWIMDERKREIETQKKLPPPVKE